MCNHDRVVCNRDRVVCNRDGMYLCVQFKLGMSLMKLSFSLESWEACGGDSDMSRDEAVLEAGKHIESALQIFQEVCQSSSFVVVGGSAAFTCSVRPFVRHVLSCYCFIIPCKCPFSAIFLSCMCNI